MRQCSLLRWLLNTLRGLFMKNPLVRVSLRVVVFLWSTLSSRGSILHWPLKCIHRSFAEATQRPPSANVSASLDVGPGRHFAQQELENTSPSGYIAQPSSPAPDLVQIHHHIPTNGTPNAFPGPRSSSPVRLVQKIAESEGAVASMSSIKRSASFSHPTICPVFPECIGRYDRNVVM